MDEDQSLRERFLNLIAVPAGLLLLVPLTLLFVVWFYMAALTEGVRLLFRASSTRQSNDQPTSPLPRPHFTETRSGQPTQHRE